MRTLHTIVAIVIVLSFTVPGWASGADHPKGHINNDNWPKGLSELANTDLRVHGYYVNFEDVLFFRGNTEKLNVFLEQYASLKGTRLEVVIHPDTLHVMSPWDEKPRETTADWQLYTSPFTRAQMQDGHLTPGPYVTRVDVWLGGDVVLSALRVPKNVLVKSGGEIEAFVEAHKQRQ